MGEAQPCCPVERRVSRPLNHGLEMLNEASRCLGAARPGEGIAEYAAPAGPGDPTPPGARTPEAAAPGAEATGAGSAWSEEMLPHAATLLPPPTRLEEIPTPLEAGHPPAGANGPWPTC